MFKRKTLVPTKVVNVFKICRQEFHKYIMTDLKTPQSKCIDILQEDRHLGFENYDYL